MKRLISLIAGSALVVFPSLGYVVTTSFPESLDGSTAVLTIESPDGLTDSVTIVDRHAVFTGKVNEPYSSTITVDDNQVAAFYISEDSINVEVTRTEIPGGVRTDWNITGGDLNTAFNNYHTKFLDLYHHYSTSKPTDSIAAQNAKRIFNARVDSLINTSLNQNIDNAFGAYLAAKLKKKQDFYDAHPSLLRFPVTVRNLQQQIAQKAIVAGQPFVDFTTKLNSEKHSLSDIAGKGKYVVVDFWASWCGPCRAAMPGLKALYETYKDKPFEIVGIPIKDNPENTRLAVEKLGITWPVWYNDKSNMAPAEAYSVESIPATFLIDPDGKIALNRPSETELKAYLDKVFSD